MNYQEMYDMMEDSIPSNPNYNNDFQTYQAKGKQYHPISPGAITEAYQTQTTQPMLYNLEGYISPYAYDNWGAPTKFLSFLDNECQLPMMPENKLDPNKIFSTDINALKTSAADQLKITRAFERKLMASLGNKDGELTETDIQAMQAITASRNTMIAASNGQVAIKKNIADIKIKQAQNKPQVNVAGTAAGSNSVFDVFGAGKNVLDGLMDIDMGALQMSNSDLGFETMSSEDANNLIDNMTSTNNEDIRFENIGAKTFVVPTPDGSYSYETYDKNGNILLDFKNPSTEIDKVDIESGFAQDVHMNIYPLRIN